MPKKKPETVPDPRINTLVRYYLNGWRMGYLDEIKGSCAWVRPVAGYKAAKRNCVMIDVNDIAPEESC